MAYAPGNSYRAGDYFAAAGPRINENIQNYLQNREERQQAVTTAEMIGRYLGDDPQFHEKFGEQFQKAPGMSTGALKGLVGSAAMYMTQQHLKAQEEAEKSRTDIAQQALGLQTGRALREADADRRVVDEEQRMAAFNQQLSQEMDPPLMYTSAAGAGPGPIDPETVARIAARTGVGARPEVTQFMNAISTYSQRGQGLPLGAVVQTPGGHQIIGAGPGQSPHFVAAKEPTQPKGLDFGVVQQTPEGAVVGLGPQNEPRFVPRPDKGKLDSSAVQAAQYIATFGQQLDAAEEAVKKYGRGWTTDPTGVATMRQLPTILAQGNAKATDPTGVVRESDIEIFRNNLFPQGTWTRPEVTQAAIENLRRDMAIRAGSFTAAHGADVPGLPPSITRHIKTPSGTATSTTNPSGTVTVIAPDGRRGNMPRDRVEEALKNGFKLAQ